MTMAVSKALEEGATVAVCASTGNTSASAAAYCGRAGIRLAVVLPEGAIARGKLAQAQICGARVIAVQGDFDDALRLVRELVERHPIALLNSINPFRLEGQKTAAFEVLEQLDGAPDWLALPVGNGGNITRLLEGVHRDGRGAADAGRPGRRGGAADRPRVPVRVPQTVATAIRIGNPARLGQALAAVTESTAASGRSTTRTSWPPTGCWPRRRACSASRRPPPRWRRCSAAAADGLVEAGSTRGLRAHRPRAEGSGHRRAGGRRDPPLPARRRASWRSWRWRRSRSRA